MPVDPVEPAQPALSPPPAASDPLPPAADRISGGIARRLIARLASIGPALLLGVAAVAAAVFVTSQYFQYQREAPVTATSIAASWNSSIAKLGITPVFPPEEDLHVGDVWAVIEDADETQAILGKAVRIAHINLREDLKREAALNRPVFSTTIEMAKDKKINVQNSREVQEATPDGRIRLSLALFPGITISKSVASSGLFQQLGVSLGLSGGRSDVEEIKIPVSETYGISSGTAAGRLDLWCRDALTSLYCQDEFVRRVMAFAVSDGVLAVKNGSYVAKIQLRLVNRVFMTREIEHRRGSDFSYRGVAGAGAPVAASMPAGVDAAVSADSRIKALEDRVSSLLAGGQGAGFNRADANELYVKQTLERPVVFGFRAVSTAITPSLPGKGREK